MIIKDIFFGYRWRRFRFWQAFYISLNYIFIKNAYHMIKIQELKQGDIVRVEEGTTERIGTVVEISRDENMVCVDNGIQEFWYNLEQIAPIPLTEKELFMLGFERADTE